MAVDFNHFLTIKKDLDQIKRPYSVIRNKVMLKQENREFQEIIVEI